MSAAGPEGADDLAALGIWDVPGPFRAIYAHSTEVPPGSRLLYVAGQVGLRPDATLPHGFEAQCVQAMVNVEALLGRAGMSREHLVKVTYLLTDVGDLLSLTELRRTRWSTPVPPAVTVVVVVALGNPNLRIEIEAVAASASGLQN